MTIIAVIGGGVAGCAAAVAAAESGARVILCESRRHLGGVAAIGEHRTLCGLAPIDAAQPELLEPDLVAEWIPEIATGPAFRQGRVWLWPTDSQHLQAGLQRRLERVAVTVRRGALVDGVDIVDERVAAIRFGDEHLAVDAVIDASGAAVIAERLGLSLRTAAQWGAYRCTLRLPGDLDGPQARVRALAIAQQVVGGTSAAALIPMGDGLWQLSLDVAPGATAATAATNAARVAEALGAQLLSAAVAVADRDHGRGPGGLELDTLFACSERGLCWAAWPREEHGPDGVAWTWPPGPRYGVPEAATRLAGGPANCWVVGKGMPVASAAAAALRVTGTCLALGAAVGLRAARCRA